MKKYAIYFVIIGIIVSTILLQRAEIKQLTAERNTYKSNTATLLSDAKHYQTKDSLNVLSIGTLELSLSEYKKYRESDYKLIQELEADKKRLEKITKTETKTKYELRTIVKDSIVYRDTGIDTLKCIQIAEKWFKLNGCSDSNKKFQGTFESIDSLMYVEHIIPKKFLFIKYGIKERRQEILSKNPYTEILSAEFITVKGSRKK